MKKPWDIEDAFEPMFDESVWLEAADGRKTTTKAAVFTDNTAEPLDADMMETECEQVNFIVKRADWPFARALRRGDVVKRMDVNGKKYAVQDVVEDEVFGLVIKARSC